MKKANQIKLLIENVLFSSKWMLVPFYLGLMVALVNFMRIDIIEVYHYLAFPEESKTASMMFLLELIDMAMVAALVRMIIIGGYTSFICKNHSDDGEKTSSGVLKVKLGTAIIGVSSINLLQTFMNTSSKVGVSNTVLYQQLLIHAAFILGAYYLAKIDFLHVQSEAIHHEDFSKHIISAPKKGDEHFTSEVCEAKTEKH